MGWDTVEAPEGSVLMKGVENERFYFVHSYAARSFTTGQDLPADSPVRRPLVTWSEHGGRFVAAVENGPLSATQFHPEPTGRAFTERMAVYRDDGYFAAPDYDRIAARVLAASLSEPPRILRAFATAF